MENTKLEKIKWSGRNLRESTDLCIHYDKMLKSCPFCSGKAFAVPSGACGAVVRCGDCSARVVSEYGLEEAGVMWNRRE